MIWDERRSINQSKVCIFLYEFKRILWFEFDRKLYDFVPLRQILIMFFCNIQNTSLKQINLYFVYFMINRFIIYKLFKVVIFYFLIKVLFIVSCIYYCCTPLSLSFVKTVKTKTVRRACKKILLQRNSIYISRNELWTKLVPLSPESSSLNCISTV